MNKEITLYLDFCGTSCWKSKFSVPEADVFYFITLTATVQH